MPKCTMLDDKIGIFYKQVVTMSVQWIVGSGDPRVLFNQQENSMWLLNPYQPRTAGIRITNTNTNT